ncbi:MAG TPA: endolytic transglycosylase MltG [Balneolaceae bacterium]|nr:endolytic transglycosylase MltG [Balneolaceae bacterium]|tara:strand:+ start:117790 stop:118869 length:1080 start_codon:yes stop_codon:yes gene_type:complete
MKLKDILPLGNKEIILSALIFTLIVVSTFTSRQIRLHSDSAIIASEKTNIQLPDKSNLDELVAVFDKAGILYNKEELYWAARILGWRTFRKGNYSLHGSYSYEQLLSTMAKGIQDPVSIVVLPGITINRLARSLSRQLAFDSLAVMQVFSDSVFLKQTGFNQEELFGRMLPETYLMYWTSSPEDVVNRMLKEFNDRTASAYKNADNDFDLSIDEVLTLASIVEWEAKDENEKPVIAGLYYNRLKRRMHLQADPTINFALGERRRLLYEDYELDHPYNTYKNYGLPPGPITNPALSTIKAVINYDHHNYLYMVANPEGGHTFTRTYEQHLVESEKWRRWLQKQYRIKRQREREAAAQLNN